MLRRFIAFILLMAPPGSLWAAQSFWHAAEAQSARALSVAGVRAIEVTFDSRVEPAQSQQLAFDLFGTTVVADQTGFERRADGWTWTGDVEGIAGHDVVLSQVDGQLAGRVATRTAAYELRPSKREAAILIQLEPTAFPPCAGAVQAANQPANRSENRSPSQMQATALSRIDVMIVYTPQVLASLGGASQVRAQAQAAVDASNISFANSQMLARFRLVAVLPTDIPEGPPATALGTYLSSLRNDPQIALQRTQYGADLVSMLVQDGLGSCGTGYVMRNVGSAFASYGFQVTASGCAVGNLSYAHEHGHNMGMEHDVANGTEPANASYPWSFGHVVDASYRTVMAYATSCTLGCPRLAYFSNPDVYYMGSPSGVAEIADNHRTGNSTVAVVAAFRADTITIFANSFD